MALPVDAACGGASPRPWGTGDALREVGTPDRAAREGAAVAVALAYEVDPGG